MRGCKSRARRCAWCPRRAAPPEPGISVGTKRQSCTSFARARHFYAAWLQVPRLVPSHKTAWVRIADPAAEHTRLSAASKANIEFSGRFGMPAAQQANLGMQGSRRCLCRGRHSRHRWLVYLQPLRLLVCRNVGLPRSPAAVAVPHKGGSALHSVLRNPGPTGANAHRLDSRGTSSARLTHAFRHGQYRIRSRGEQTVHHLQIFVQLVAAWAYKLKWSVLASHIPGEHNVWADQLSRGNTSAFDSKPQARFRFRPHDFWPHQCRLSLRPPDAPWRPEHKSASQTL